jgi:ribosome-interacting GTPase 1
MARTQKNKATAHHLGLLKAKLAKLKRELLDPVKGSGGGATGEGMTRTIHTKRNQYLYQLLH